MIVCGIVLLLIGKGDAKSLTLAAALVTGGIGLLCARDNKVSSEEAGATPEQKQAVDKLAQPTKVALILIGLFLFNQARAQDFTQLSHVIAMEVADAVTNPAPTPPPSGPSTTNFFQTIESYFTAFNTNLATFAGTNANYQLWTGVGYQSGINLGADIGLEAQPFNNGLTIGSVSTLSSTVGTIAQQEADIGWSVIHYDVRLTFGGAMTETFQSGALGDRGLGGGFYVQVEKALTANTFAGTRLKESFGSGQHASQPYLGFFAGFTF
jgi:hypothetical protein